MQIQRFDILIVGGGIAGTALALMLAQHTSLHIALLEKEAISPNWQEGAYHHRVSAINLATQRLLNNLEVWDMVAKKRISPFLQISASDQIEEIHFDCREIAEHALGFIIENKLLLSVLREKLTQYDVAFIAPANLREFESQKEYIRLIADEVVYEGKLAVAADGGQSWLRKQAQIDVQKLDYHQQAIVTTVRTRLPHQKKARQVFLPEGPLAFLPLIQEDLCSIVWSLPEKQAKILMEQDDECFKSALDNAFSKQLGNVEAIAKRFAFPLCKQEAKKYIGHRLALIGDAAHIVHPLAGLGVNMGLLDAASLFEVIYEAQNKRRDFASSLNLRRYERWRKADNVALQEGIHWLKCFFANDQKPIPALRAMGLKMTNASKWVKRQIISHAVGNRVLLPKLARKTIV